MEEKSCGKLNAILITCYSFLCNFGNFGNFIACLVCISCLSLFFFREAYKQRLNPLHQSEKKTMVTENILLREIVWYVMENVSQTNYLRMKTTPNPTLVLVT